MKQILLTALAAFVFCTANAQTLIDVLPGHKGLVSEFFFLKPIDTKERWLAVSRSELYLPEYETEHLNFLNFNTFSYNFKNHLGLTVGTYGSSHYRFSARLGLQYFKENETYLLYANLSSAVTKNPDGQLLVIGTYTPNISEHWKIFTRAECRTAVSYKEGFAFSNQMIRLGAQYDRFILGLGAELEEMGDHSETGFESNIGPFIRIILDRWLC